MQNFDSILPQVSSLIGRPLPSQDRARRVYVNRNLRLDMIELVGFDMDYTLAMYKQPAMEALSIECTVKKLVYDKGYPRDILSLTADPAFAMRGLVIDKDHGNLLKMDRHYFVGQAYHGTRKLSRRERRSRYAEERIDIGLEKYACIDTLFALPEACMFAALVDLFKQKKQPINYRKLWQDIREAIDMAHRDDSIKREIKAETHRFVIRDPELPLTLHNLRSSGKKLFLLTNSYWDYTQHLMTYLFEGMLSGYPTWESFFDFIIVGAKKPTFFMEQPPLLLLNEKGEPLQEVNGPLERTQIYQGGNLIDFENAVGIRGDKILYIGDHIYGDMLRSKKSSTWRTAMIIQEMEDELAVAERHKDLRDSINDLESRRDLLEHEINYRATLLHSLPKMSKNTEELAPETLEKARKDLKLEIDHLRREQREVIQKLDQAFSSYEKWINPYWGSLFKNGNENSRFGEQIDDYACLYTSRVSNLLYYSPMHYFVAPPDLMPHEHELPPPVTYSRFTQTPRNGEVDLDEEPEEEK